jgi:hypothetical protein
VLRRGQGWFSSCQPLDESTSRHRSCRHYTVLLALIRKRQFFAEGDPGANLISKPGPQCQKVTEASGSYPEGCRFKSYSCNLKFRINTMQSASQHRGCLRWHSNPGSAVEARE